MPRNPVRLATAAASSMLVGGLLFAAPVAAVGTAQNYVVVYSSSAVPWDAARTISAAGGSVVASYNAIGVVTASSDRATFASKLKADRRVSGAVASGPSRRRS